MGSATVIRGTFPIRFGCGCVITFSVYEEIDVVGWSNYDYEVEKTCCGEHESLLVNEYHTVLDAVKDEVLTEPVEYLKYLAAHDKEYVIPEELEEFLRESTGKGSVSREAVDDCGVAAVEEAVNAGRSCSFILCPRCYRWVPHDEWVITAPLRVVCTGTLKRNGSVTAVVLEEKRQGYDFVEWSHPNFGAGCCFSWPDLDLSDFWVCEVGEGKAVLRSPQEGGEGYVRSKEAYATARLRDVLRRRGILIDVLDVA